MNVWAQQVRFWPWSVSLFRDSIPNYWLSGYFFMRCTSSNDAHSHLYWQQTQVWCVHPFHITDCILNPRLNSYSSPLISCTVTIIGPNHYFHHVRYCSVELSCDISVCVWICFCVGISICVEWPSSLSPPAVETHWPVTPGQAPVLLSLVEYQITIYQRGPRLRKKRLWDVWSKTKCHLSSIIIHGSNIVLIIRQLCMRRISVFTTRKW